MGKLIEIIIKTNLLLDNWIHELAEQISVLNSGTDTYSIIFNRPSQGLLIGPGILRVWDDFSYGAVLLCLASEHYDAADYIRDYDEFLKYKKQWNTFLPILN